MRVSQMRIPFTDQFIISIVNNSSEMWMKKIKKWINEEKKNINWRKERRIIAND